MSERQRIGKIGIDISGLDPESQKNILKALAENEKEGKREKNGVLRETVHRDFGLA